MLAQKQYAHAVIMALRLNELDLMRRVVRHVPQHALWGVTQAIPSERLQRILQVLALEILEQPYLELYMDWIRHLLLHHGDYMKQHKSQFLSRFRDLQRGVRFHNDNITKLANFNGFQLTHLKRMIKLNELRQAEQEGMETGNSTTGSAASASDS